MRRGSQLLGMTIPFVMLLWAALCSSGCSGSTDTTTASTSLTGKWMASMDDGSVGVYDFSRKGGITMTSKKDAVDLKLTGDYKLSGTALTLTMKNVALTGLPKGYEKAAQRWVENTKSIVAKPQLLTVNFDTSERASLKSDNGSVIRLTRLR